MNTISHRPMPTTQGIKDAETRRVVEPMRANIQTLLNKTITIDHLKELGLLDQDGNAVSASTTAPSTGNAVRWITGVLDLSKGLEAGIHPTNIKLPAGSILLSAAADVQQGIQGSGQFGLCLYPDGIKKAELFPLESIFMMWQEGFMRWTYQTSTDNFIPKLTEARVIYMENNGSTITSGYLRVFIQVALSEV